MKKIKDYLIKLPLGLRIVTISMPFMIIFFIWCIVADISDMKRQIKERKIWQSHIKVGDPTFVTSDVPGAKFPKGTVTSTSGDSVYVTIKTTRDNLINWNGKQ